ncbi:MAG: hypothetical protein M5U10_00585 [Candidatus Methanoperedens sp.]|nr:hypothetical protein [Candidatus Methanoperedens nitroreducens]MDJ1420388.1 hypothetical protein [Candidatus Methanoperedens sp.]
MPQTQNYDKQKAVTDRSEIEAYDGQHVVVYGRYQAVPMPTKAVNKGTPPAEYAIISLKDGTRVYMESYNTDEAKRPLKERTRFDGKMVRVTGTIHRRMPTKGQGLVAPSINDITDIIEEDAASEKDGKG